MGESAQKIAFEINTEQCGRGHSFKSISYAEQAKNAGLRITAVKYFLCGTGIKDGFIKCQVLLLDIFRSNKVGKE